MSVERASPDPMTADRPGAQRLPANRIADHPIAGFKPQKRLFLILCVCMTLWIAALLTMYFTTVWPQRHAGTPLPREKDVDDHRATTLTG